LVLLVAIAGAALLPDVALATTFTVDTSSDPASTDCTPGHPAGTCSLRGAIAAAASADTVVIAPNVDPVLTMGEIATGTPVTIQGQGARSTVVSGNNASGIFHVTAGGLTISALTLTGGSSSTFGGALYNQAGTTSLTDVAVKGNAVTGASAFGGGITNGSGATLTLLRVTVSGNSATATSGGAGGGIVNGSGSTLTAVNSTITNNTESGSGSGTVSGGGLYNIGSATLTNVTVASNTVTATGSGASFGGNIITVGVGAVSTLKNTLVAYGTADSGSNCFTGSGGASFVTQGGNL
jgi:hypothetical protein